jgi:hypothetical protein
MARPSVRFHLATNNTALPYLGCAGHLPTAALGRKSAKAHTANASLNLPGLSQQTQTQHATCATNKPRAKWCLLYGASKCDMHSKWSHISRSKNSHCECLSLLRCQPRATERPAMTRGVQGNTSPVLFWVVPESALSMGATCFKKLHEICQYAWGQRASPARQSTT